MNATSDIVQKLWNLCHVLRDDGITYLQYVTSPGVKTNVLFFQRGATEKGNTENVWVYDLQMNMSSFGKRTPLPHTHFKDFEQCYGEDPNGGSPRTDQGEEGRFRCFSREFIKDRGENLDISWLQDESLQSAHDLPEPEEIAAAIMKKLQVAMTEM